MSTSGETTENKARCTNFPLLYVIAKETNKKPMSSKILGFRHVIERDKWRNSTLPATVLWSARQSLRRPLAMISGWQRILQQGRHLHRRILPLCQPKEQSCIHLKLLRRQQRSMSTGVPVLDGPCRAIALYAHPLQVSWQNKIPSCLTHWQQKLLFVTMLPLNRSVILISVPNFMMPLVPLWNLSLRWVRKIHIALERNCRHRQ